MQVFTPPTLDRVPPVAADTVGVAARLFGRVHPTTQGLNVFIMADNTVLIDGQPQHLSNPDPSRPEFDVGVPAATFYGGHVYVVTDAQAALLSAAGLGANLTAYTPPVDIRQYYEYGAGHYGLSQRYGGTDR